MTVPFGGLSSIRNAVNLARTVATKPTTTATPDPVPPQPPPGIPGFGGGLLGGVFGGGVQPAAPAQPAPAQPAAPDPSASGPFTAAPPPPPNQPAAPIAVNTGFVRAMPDLTLATTNIRDFVALPPLVPLPFPPPVRPEAVPVRRTFTDLANEAIARLRGAPSDALSETIRTLQGKAIPGPNLLSWIERKTRVGEVLGGPSSQWSADTVTDFAAAFQMDPARRPVMDLIVAVATLNERELEAELRSENMPDVTAADLLQNRRVVFQYPPPGTELQPPYVILVAVEHQDLQRAADVVASIMGQLVEVGGFRIPRDAAARLG